MHANDDLAQLKKHYGMEHKERQNQNTRRGNPYMGFLWGILIVLLLNALVFPSFNGRRIVETDYGTFIGKVDSGSVKQIMIKNGEIYFTAESGGKTTAYRTGEIYDPELVTGCSTRRVLTRAAGYRSAGSCLRKTHRYSISC